MARKKRMTDDELSALCFQEWQDADAYLGEISDDRKDALDAYNQEPYGNEEDGLSQFVTSDVRDAIEWTLPQIYDIFQGGETPVMFMPQGAADKKAAEDETRAVTHVFNVMNEGSLIAYSWFKDALMQKNGIIKVYDQENEAKEREEYKNKSLQDYTALQADKEIEIDEVTFCIDGNEYDEKEYAEAMHAVSTDPQAAQAVAAETTVDIVAFRTKKITEIKIENVPPENFRVKRDHNSPFLYDAPYTAEDFVKTRSELIAAGYDKKMVEALPANQHIFDANGERQVRFRKEGGMIDSQGPTGIDPSREEIYLTLHFIRADQDGDGISEMRAVLTCGHGAEYILENDAVDRNIYHAITPYLNTHKFFGRSLADNLVDLQRAKSQIWRNMFDNYMYSAIPRKIISGNVNVKDLLSYIPGGLIRKGDAQATIENDVVPFVAGDGMGIMDRLDQTRAERSGFSSQTMGLDPAAIANATNLVGMSQLSQSQLLVKMIASLFAATGYQTMMLHIRELVMKVGTDDFFQDLDGEPLQTDPRDWKKRRRTKVKVGIGFAGKQEKIATMQNVITLQTQAMVAQQSVTGPLVNPPGVFNAADQLLRAMGMEDAASYFQDPATYQVPPPPPPSIAEVQTKAGIDKMNADVKTSEAKQVLDTQEQKNNHELNLAKLAQTERLEKAKLEENARQFDVETLNKYGQQAHAHALAVNQTLSDERNRREDNARADQANVKQQQQDANNATKQTKTVKSNAGTAGGAGV